jgi:hypothetical protein
MQGVSGVQHPWDVSSGAENRGCLHGVCIPFPLSFPNRTHKRLSYIPGWTAQVGQFQGRSPGKEKIGGRVFSCLLPATTTTSCRTRAASVTTSPGSAGTTIRFMRPRPSRSRDRMQSRGPGFLPGPFTENVCTFPAYGQFLSSVRLSCA